MYLLSMPDKPFTPSALLRRCVSTWPNAQRCNRARTVATSLRGQRRCSHCCAAASQRGETREAARVQLPPQAGGAAAAAAPLRLNAAKRPALQLPRPPLLTPLLLLRDGEFDNAHLGVPDDLVEIYPKWKNFHKNLNYNQLRQLVGALPPSTTLGFISVGIRGWSTAAVAIPPFSVAPLSAKVAVDRPGRPTLSRSRHGLHHRRRHHQVRRASFQRG